MRALRGAAALLALFALAVLAPRAARAQDPTGTVVGRVVDAQSGRGLSGARVAVQGTTVAATAGVDGRFTLARVPAGTHSLSVSMLGYGTKTVTGVQVGASASVSADVSLSPAAVALAGISVTASRERGSVARALDEQRNAVGIVNATTSEQIARSPDADAARAVQRVSGVTVQDGKYVFVRGLGERYTTTSLNGVRIPSPEPERKVVPLDLFPSSLLEAISTSKTFTPDQPADFSGAQVNLRTRSFPARRTVTYSLSAGVNDALFGRNVYRAPRAGGEWLAEGASDRALPPAVANGGIDGSTSRAQLNGMIRSFRDSWWAQRVSGQPNLTTAFTVGGEDPVLGHRLGYVGSLTYSHAQTGRVGMVRSRVGATAGGVPRAQDVFTGSAGQETTLWGGMLNLSTFLGSGSKVELNNTYSRGADNTAQVDWGTLEQFSQYDSVQSTQLRYVERSVRSHQLRGTHELGGSTVDWSLSASAVSRKEPDRSDIAYGYDTDPATGHHLPFAWLGLPGASTRTFGDLAERGRGADANWRLPFGGAAAEHALKLGVSYRTTHRDADSRAYDILPAYLPAGARQLPPSQIFDGRFASDADSALTLNPNTTGGLYTAGDRVAGEYAMLEYGLGSRLKLVGGARVEQWRLRMNVQGTTGEHVNVARDNTDVLPSLALTVALSDQQNLRLSATQTLSRPEYRELAPIGYSDVLASQDVIGNPGLVRTLVQNYDLRWEWYPAGDEVLSASLFAKHFDRPIEQIEVARSGAQQLGYANAAAAVNYGVEMEMRKGLGFLADRLDPVTAFANATVMHSQIRTGEDSNGSALTNANRPMVGQAPYVVNAGFTWAPGAGETSATLLYNVVGRRIRAAAVVPITVDTYEMPRQSLDASLRVPLGRTLSGKLDAGNLLDSPYEEKQGDVIRRRYRTGRTLSLGLAWHPPVGS
jgi:TonB-dependent receptor